jgi:GNAT superfamily N-acetyltransferase
MRDFMRLIEADLEEYQKIPPMPLGAPDFTPGGVVGTINTGSGVLAVWKIEDGDAVGYGAVDPASGPATPLGFLGFAKAGSALVAKNAWTDPAHVRKGIQSELFLFVNKAEKFSIISDTQLTDDGEKLWQSLMKSLKFDSKIFYVPTRETFAVGEIGKSHTFDGSMVIDPVDDFFHGDFYDTGSNTGQCFFYLLEGRFMFVEHHQGKTYRFGYSRPGLSPLIAPQRYFADGEY